MSASRKLIGIASTLVILASTQIGFAAGNQTSAGGRLLAMDDDMKPKQQDSMQPSGRMGQPTGQPQQMGRDRMMMEDKMRMQSPPMQDSDDICQGSTCQKGAQGGMMMMEKMMRSQMGRMSGTADVTERIEGRIAFLKAELQITDKQTADWNALAEALRSGRQHLVEARKLLTMDDKTTSADRLERYERHLTERLEAIKSARATFVRLYPTLNDSQKQTADAILLPLIATF
jgi:hypothetical protein